MEVLLKDPMKEVLDNKMILAIISGNLVSNSSANVDLKNCRLVCSEWKKVATRILQKRNLSCRKFILFRNDKQVQKYLDTFAGNQENATFCCFHFESNDKYRHKFDAVILDKFFQTFQHSICSLQLIMRLDSLNQLDSILGTQAKSLIELKVQNVRDLLTLIEEGEESEMTLVDPEPESLDFYLSSLKLLCIGLDFYSKNILKAICRRIPSQNRHRNKIEIRLFGPMDETKEVIDTLKNHEQIKILKSLHALGCMNNDAKQFDEAGVELEFLSLDIQQYSFRFLRDVGQGHVPLPHVAMGLDARSYEMYEYVRTQRKTLKMLSWTNKVFRFPPWGMPQLKKLRLEVQNRFGLVFLDGEEPFEPVQFPILYKETFPKLEELVLSTDDDNRVNRLEFTTTFLSQQEPCPNIQKLNIHYAKLNAQMLSTISTTFPRIKFLEIGMSRDEIGDQVNQQNFYSVLWKAEFASTIEELVIEMNGRSPGVEFELDSLYSGVDKEEIQQIVSAQSYNQYEIKEEAQGHGSILNFKSLKRLELRASSFYPIFYGTIYFSFGEFSAYCVFGRMKSLKYLHVDNILAKFSPLTILTMRDKLQNLQTNNPYPTETVAAADRDPIEKAFLTDFDSYCQPERKREYFNLLE